MVRAKLWVGGTLLALASFGLGYVTASRFQPRGTVSPMFARLPSTRSTTVLDSPPAPEKIPVSSPNAVVIDIPRTRTAAQELARERFIRFSQSIQNFQIGGYGRPNPDLFFLPSHYSGWSGLCRATAVEIGSPAYGAIRSQPRFLVVGGLDEYPGSSVKGKPGYGAYKAWEDEIERNCAARDASTSWFTVDGEETSSGVRAWQGARLADGVIAAARAPGALSFPINCGRSWDPQRSFCANPRRSLALLDPGKIASIKISETIYNGIDHRDTVISTQGNPIVEITIREESPGRPGDKADLVIKNVAIAQQAQPIID